VSLWRGVRKMGLFITIIIVLILLITIVVSIFTYRDWKENFQDDYRDMMAGYEEKKKGEKNER
jgi:tellurite resistance protein TehA-like permease